MVAPLRAASRFVAKPHVRAGLAAGMAAAVESNQPSLMPRPRTDQALVVAGSIATGYVAGSALGRVADVVALPSPRPSKLLPNRASRAVAGVAIGAAAIAGTAAYLRSRLARYELDGRIPPDGADVAWTLAVGTGVAAAAGTAALATRKGARGLAVGIQRTVGGPMALWIPVAHGVVAAGVVAAGRAGASRVFGKIAASNQRTESRYADPPTLSTVSGSETSAVEFSELGLQGRRFVSETSTAGRINELLGEEGALDAVRVFVGIESADTVEDRVALAIEELHRTGGFDRSLLIVGSPAGTGYFNYIPVEAAEYLTRGDVASVAIQYGSLPSMLSISKVGLAVRQHAALLEAIAAVVEDRDPQHRPRVVLYGESLGAQTSQGAFVGTGTEGLAVLGIDRALWVGTPHASKWRQEIFAEGSLADQDLFASFSSIDEYHALAEAARNRLRYFFLDHHEDPVTRFATEISYKRPLWLGTPDTRPPNVSRTQRWVPGVTYWQTAIDTKNAATVIPGEFRAFGHDYRADLGEFIRAAYALDDVSDEQMERIEKQLRASEIARAAKIADG